MKRMAAFVAVVIMLLVAAPVVCAQQVTDEKFRFSDPNPAYREGEGPRVCIDAAHNNFHTADGRYKPFADLLRGDGYRVSGTTGKFSPTMLAACDVLVISNAIGDDNRERWAFPHPSAFTRAEIEAVYNWIRGGGALLLIVDHAPMAGAASDLGAMLGVAMLDGYTRGRRGPPAPLPDVFSWESGLLADHAIVGGRNDTERISRVATFTGHAFLASNDFAPILRFGPDAVATVHLGFNFEDLPSDQWPRFSISGWLHAASRRLGKGRVVLLGEAAMCTAQVAGREREPMGMNHPAAAQNAQFCISTVRWLSGLLGD
ncbi:MAG TPA: hypothetical protein VGA40_04365 [Candidatus Acidoferrales bacterium]